MKSAAAVALVALPFALASPYHMQQHAERALVIDWVTDVNVVTVFAEVTEFATGPPPAASTTVVVPAPSSAADVQKEEHHWTWSGQEGHGQWSHQAPPATSAPAPAPPAPTTSSTTSSSSSTSEAPVYVPPTTSSTTTTPSSTSTTETPTSTWVYVAPTTTAAPATTAAPTTYASPPQYANTGVGPYLIPAASSTFSADVSAKTGAAGYSYDGAMQAALLNSTNWWRSQFQASPLTWSYDLQAKAQNNANGCQFEHDSAGQNLAAGYSGPESANDGWAGEYTSFNFANPDFTEDTGHFTQVVWQDTTQIGCAAVNCGSNNPAQGWYLVCNYLPVGNMLGEFAQNVKTKI